jgi:hypothetical protein
LEITARPPDPPTEPVPSLPAGPPPESPAPDPHETFALFEILLHGALDREDA